MSVFIVSPEHINVLLDAALRYTDNIGMTVYTSNSQALTIDRTNRDKVGQMLLDTNAASAGARHQEDTELYIYSYATPARFDWEAIDILKAISCYEYQANEAPGWDTSTARAFCEALRRAVIPALPGYADAPWEITTTSTPAPTIY
ncbi:hypothetical protein [Actinomyces oris]|uniref:hypothetical protein n=1 Tax=Actinomyces oris TaxID=544580 RepID=UPI0022FD4896|nr:hypothetical protein [Actinomyces oris]WCA42335.1 hypothetical protein PGE45_09410 [Actinomyces oris]